MSAAHAQEVAHDFTRQIGTIAPYTMLEIAEAFEWLPYVQAALDTAADDPTGSIVEAIDKAHRRGAIGDGVASLLSEVFDVPNAYSMQVA